MFEPHTNASLYYLFIYLFLFAVCFFFISFYLCCCTQSIYVMQVGVFDRDDQTCQYEGCTEIDLLPAICTNCGRRFCSQHIVGSAHHCNAVTDIIVASCPLCHRVVPLEYPKQKVDEAVSRHIDRGCRDVPQSSSPQMSSTPSQADGGRRLGSGKDRCSYPQCSQASTMHVRCDQCGKEYCLQHRNPVQHDCVGKRGRPESSLLSRITGGAAAKSPQRSTERKLPTLGTGPVSIQQLLMHPLNTSQNAIGRKTELPSDMVTPLVCFLIPNSDGTTYAPIPCFFMYVAKNLALGRVLDQATDFASFQSATVKTIGQWKLFAVTLPVHKDARPSNYPTLPLSKSVRETPVGASTSSILFATPLPSLPSDLLMSVSTAQKEGTMGLSSSSSSDGCSIM